MANKPSHRVYLLKTDKEGKRFPFSTAVGAAWPHKDGKGYDVFLDAVPLDGKLTMREATDQGTAETVEAK